ncbi:MAG TPA: HtaA domain-containing protein [Solirubrobacterales bacterium]|nr:HtaA domain-containing protein [Solirubrobacterales bacterium]
MKAALSALALALVLVAAAPAGAAEPVGSANLVITAGKWRTLSERGIWLGGSGAAESEGRRTRLSVRGGSIGDTSASLLNPGALELTAGSGRTKTAVKLTAMRVELGSRSWLSAKLGKKRRPIFKLERGTLSTNGAGGAAKLEGASVSWQPATLRALRKRLGAHLPGGTLGSLSITAATLLAETPQSGPIAVASPLLPRPATAIDVTAATLAWHVRDSWIRYLNTEQAPQALEGAVPEAAIPESQHPCPDRPAETNPTLVYSYDFPFANGWYDPPSGSAALYYRGGVRFSYPSHGIEIVARNPEIEINGAASQAIFNLYGGGQTAYPEQRASLLRLAPAIPTQSGPGAFGFPGPLRGTLTADGQRVFAGFYPPPNDGFGCVSVSFRTG